MNTNDIFARLAGFKVVPVIAIEESDRAIPLADALIEGGLPVAEITFRTKAAAAVLSTLAKQRPQIALGAGTILTADLLRQARDCGATFGLAPGFNRDVVETAQKLGFPFAPGIMTPSDIEAALSTGLSVLKFFPAGAAGGAPMLKSISAPYAHTGVKFIPTGGVTATNLSEYLSLKNVLAVGGTWIATADDITSGNWKKISANCKEALANAGR